jgi:hypothetical protein
MAQLPTWIIFRYRQRGAGLFPAGGSSSLRTMQRVAHSSPILASWGIRQLGQNLPATGSRFRASYSCDLYASFRRRLPAVVSAEGDEMTLNSGESVSAQGMGTIQFVIGHCLYVDIPTRQNRA